MRAKPCIITLFFVALIAFPPSGDIHGSELTEAEFKQLQKELQPDSTEPWRTIPWKISLLDAQQTAAKEQKPIFIWAMDGHPLGCT